MRPLFLAGISLLSSHFSELSPEQTKAIDQAVARLRAGQLVAMPTETVYGLAADAGNEAAIERVFALKGRPSDRPLIVHLADASGLDRWASAIPDYAHAFAAAFWPGPLTLVLPKQERVSMRVTGGQDTVALRVPDHPMALALLTAFGKGLVAPSANRYGHISPTSAGDVKAEFGEDAPLILDGGACQVGIESTIVSCLDEIPRVLRLGSISPEALASVAGCPVEVVLGQGDVVVPGQVLSHYAPRTPTCWLGSEDARSEHLGVKRVGFLGFSEPPIPCVQSVVLPLDPKVAAQKLYASLRSLDELGLDLIVIESPPSGDEWAAIRDRLSRATA